MRFGTGTSEIRLPYVAEFSFAITGISLADTGKVSFAFFDTVNDYFQFSFGSGKIVGPTNATLGFYNVNETHSISGYYSADEGSVLNYFVDGIFYQQVIGSFESLASLVVSASTSPVLADVNITSNPIYCSLSLDPNYKYYDVLNGLIYADTAFPTLPPTFTFYNSNKPLLSGNYSSGIAVNGPTVISFTDIDTDFTEYANEFFISIPTTFGDIGGRFKVNRTGVSSAPILTLADASGNSYYQTSDFNGEWSGSTFSYQDNVLTYNLGFDYSHTSSVGDPYQAELSISFMPLKPGNMSGYASQYITGVTMTASGMYSGTPAFSGAQYYYVTGVQNSLSSFLFSTGCTGNLNVSYAGGGASSGASGAFILKQVRLSGIYNPGVAYFKMVSGYSGKSLGSGYRNAPTFSISTGGACYSLPDYSGVELYQFTRATGYGALYAQAAGLTGLVIMSGSGVSGVQVTNIGFGYSAAQPPTLGFIRQSGDTGVLNASGSFGYKTTGVYDFDQFWKASFSFGEGGIGFSGVSGYSGGYSGKYGVSGIGNLQVQLVCSGLDNTSPVSGLLTISITGNGLSLTSQKVISQSRIFDLSTGALMTTPPPSNPTIPAPDLYYAFDQDQYDYQYISDAGQKIDNIISF
jgi:hypothetical protein